MEYGIVIIALGYELYGNAAFNLALSIKDSTPDVPIALVYEENSISKLSTRELTYFDKFVKIPESWYTVEGKKQYQRAKLCVNLVSNKLCWKNTIYMDDDNMWFDKPVDDLFNRIKEREFYIGYNGYYDVLKRRKVSKNYTFWARNESVKTVCDYHKIKNNLPQTISGFYFFQNGPKADSIFEEARKVYDDPNAPTITWANGKPDEYCMNIALGEIDFKQEEAHIFYFQNVNGSLNDDVIERKFWGFATGGNKVPERLVHWFNRRVNILCKKHNIESRHYHIDKKDVILERKSF